MRASSVAAWSRGQPGPHLAQRHRPREPAAGSACLTGRLRPPRGRRGGLGLGRAGGSGARRGRPASRSRTRSRPAPSAGGSPGPSGPGSRPSRARFDLLVALLDPVPQAVQPHDLGQVGRGRGGWRVGAGWSAGTRCCARAGWPGRSWRPPAAAAGPGPSRRDERRPPTRSRRARRGSAASTRRHRPGPPGPPPAHRRPPRPGCGPPRPAPSAPAGLQRQHVGDRPRPARRRSRGSRRRSSRPPPPGTDPGVLGGVHQLDRELRLGPEPGIALAPGSRAAGV